MVRFTDYLKYATTKTDTSQENGVIASPKKRTIEKHKPRLVLELKGERSLLGADDELRVPLAFRSIQGLILQALILYKPSQAQTWCKFFNTTSICNATLVIVDGWDLSDLACILSEEDEPPEKKIKVSDDNFTNSYVNQSKGDLSLVEMVDKGLPFTSSSFPLKLEVEPPFEYSDDPVEELFSSIPMSSNIVSAIKEKHRNLRLAAKLNIVSPILREDKIKLKEKFTSIMDDHRDQFDRVRLLLSAQEMAKFDYPLGVEGTASERYRDYIPLHSQFDKVTKTSPMFGIDCEMWKSDAGVKLSRISVVDEKLNVIYSSFLNPNNVIVSYLNNQAGTTPTHLLNVASTLRQVQEELRDILPKDCILVGHGLENDLEALKILHPYVIDTSRIYNLSHNKTRKPTLKLLTKLFLKKDIQSDNKKGHDPSEDAAAALELVLLKLRNNISFGDVTKGGNLPCSKEDLSRISLSNKLEKVNSFNSAKTLYGENYESTLPKIIKLERKNSSLVFSNDAETLNYFKSYGVDQCRLANSLSEVLEIEPKTYADFKFVVQYCKVQDTTSAKSQKRLRKKLKIIDEKLSALHNSVPENSLILALFTKKRDLSVPRENQPNGFLFLDLKCQESNSFYKS